MSNTSERVTILATAHLPADAVRAIRHNDGTLCDVEHLPVLHDLMAARLLPTSTLIAEVI
jgi:hypothetical protein